MSEQINKAEHPFAHLVQALQEGEALRLSQCIEQIDNRLVNCRKSLEEYRRKRDFKKTSELSSVKAKAKTKALSFVVQKHDATRLHYDFRLEMDGVLKSWAV